MSVFRLLRFGLGGLISDLSSRPLGWVDQGRSDFTSLRNSFEQRYIRISFLIFSKINNDVTYWLRDLNPYRHRSLLRRPRPVETTGCGQQSAAYDLHMLTRIRLYHHYLIISL